MKRNEKHGRINKLVDKTLPDNRQFELLNVLENELLNVLEKVICLYLGDMDFCGYKFKFSFSLLNYP